MGCFMLLRHVMVELCYTTCYEITSQRVLDQSQAGVYRGKPHIPLHFGPFGRIRIYIIHFYLFFHDYLLIIVVCTLGG